MKYYSKYERNLKLSTYETIRTSLYLWMPHSANDSELLARSKSKITGGKKIGNQDKVSVNSANMLLQTVCILPVWPLHTVDTVLLLWSGRLCHLQRL